MVCDAVWTRMKRGMCRSHPEHPRRQRNDSDCVRCGRAELYGGSSPVNFCRRLRARECPQATSATSSPPREPLELLHAEGKAAAEGIDGGGGLGFEVRRRRGAARVSGEKDGAGGSGSFIGGGDRWRFTGPRLWTQGRASRGADSKYHSGVTEVSDDHRVPLVSDCRGRRRSVLMVGPKVGRGC
jgi:hypothetical protein